MGRMHVFRRTRQLALALGAVFALANLGVASAAAPRAGVPLPRATLDAMLASMSERERSVRADAFAPGHVIVAYQRLYLPTDASGTPSGDPIRLDATQDTDVSPLSATGNGLYISVSAQYEKITGASVPHRWNIDFFWDWRGGPYDWPTNSTNDHVATAWGGDLGLLSKYAYGYYPPGKGSITMTPGPIAVNSGFDYYFREWSPTYKVSADWGHELSTIGETSLQNKASGVAVDYVHTYSFINVSVGFAAPKPTITLSTGDGNWELGDFVPVVF